MTLPDGRGGPHAFVADFEVPVLSPVDHQHLARSLRLRVGDPLTVSDGYGLWMPCQFTAVGEPLKPAGDAVLVPEPRKTIEVGFVPVKGAKAELVVAGLTELGVDRISLLMSERSVVRWDTARAERNHERLLRVVRESGMQSRRVRLPELSEVREVSQFGEAAAADDTRVLLADPVASADALLGSGQLGPARTALLVGPEGGWSDSERARFTHHVRLCLLYTSPSPRDS